MQCKVILNISSSPSNLWLTKAKPFNYADDTTTSCKGKDTKKIIEDLESEAQDVLHFKASNGLIIIIIIIITTSLSRQKYTSYIDRVPYFH